LERTSEIYVGKGNPNFQTVMKASHLIILKMKIHRNAISHEENYQLLHINVFTAFYNEGINYVM